MRRLRGRPITVTTSTQATTINPESSRSSKTNSQLFRKLVEKYSCDDVRNIFITTVYNSSLVDEAIPEIDVEPIIYQRKESKAIKYINNFFEQIIKWVLKRPSKIIKNGLPLEIKKLIEIIAQNIKEARSKYCEETHKKYIEKYDYNNI